MDSVLDRLYKKMHMVLVCSYFDKYHLISFSDLKANISDLIINLFAKNNFSVFCWTDKVIKQNRDIMTLMYIFAHA